MERERYDDLFNVYKFTGEQDEKVPEICCATQCPLVNS